ncbi:hypothetical protein CPAV1605_645 [seawater metagenome]|uniref:SprT-like family n=1 Tax=seawater metagenome TaxID=1561972 RepID=A0A5E8CM84_9ZZZZ
MLLRSHIVKAVEDAKKWFLIEEKKGKNSLIYKSAKSHLRGGNFIIWYDEANYKLNHVELYHGGVNEHWGETDGITIWLNTCKNWNHELLKNILIHEALHFTIRNQGKYDLSEKKEHNIMFEINPNLIDI